MTSEGSDGNIKLARVQLNISSNTFKIISFYRLLLLDTRPSWELHIRLLILSVMFIFYILTGKLNMNIFQVNFSIKFKSLSMTKK